MKQPLVFLFVFVALFCFTSGHSFRHKKLGENSEHNKMERNNKNLVHHWPHLEGVDAAAAEASIKQDRPEINVYKVSKVIFGA